MLTELYHTELFIQLDIVKPATAIYRVGVFKLISNGKKKLHGWKDLY